MKQYKKIMLWAVGIIMMIPLIFDAEASLRGAKDGVELCISTVIPTLFPFFFITAWIRRNTGTAKKNRLQKLENFCKIPEGSGIILLMGFLSGYPIGAKMITDACKNGNMDRDAGERMLCFCNQAGPAFILGISGSLFTDVRIAFILWAVIVFSALLTALLIPAGQKSRCQYKTNSPENVLNASITAMASVCGWVILFRILITILNRWILWILPPNTAVILTGFLELTNGCILLHTVSDYRFRFIAAAVFLSLGGLCVTMQTISVTYGLNTKKYIIGKLIQGVIAVLLAASVSVFLFPVNTL